MANGKSVHNLDFSDFCLRNVHHKEITAEHRGWMPRATPFEFVGAMKMEVERGIRNDWRDFIARREQWENGAEKFHFFSSRFPFDFIKDKQKLLIVEQKTTMLCCYCGEEMKTFSERKYHEYFCHFSSLFSPPPPGRVHFSYVDCGSSSGIKEIIAKTENFTLKFFAMKLKTLIIS